MQTRTTIYTLSENDMATVKWAEDRCYNSYKKLNRAKSYPRSSRCVAAHQKDYDCALHALTSLQVLTGCINTNRKG